MRTFVSVVAVLLGLSNLLRLEVTGQVYGVYVTETENRVTLVLKHPHVNQATMTSGKPPTINNNDTDLLDLDNYEATMISTEAPTGNEYNRGLLEKIYCHTEMIKTLSSVPDQGKEITVSSWKNAGTKLLEVIKQLNANRGYHESITLVTPKGYVLMDSHSLTVKENEIIPITIVDGNTWIAMGVSEDVHQKRSQLYNTLFENNGSSQREKDTVETKA